ncbi:MAG: TonB-dependent receptor [Gemmatimonadota bacterium]
MRSNLQGLHQILSVALCSVGLAGPATAMALDTHVRAVAGQEAEIGSIVGRVVDDVSGQPIANVAVRLRETGRALLTRADGVFVFADVPERSYTVLAQRIGYAPVEVTVDVGTDQTVEVELRMVPSALELAGVVVTGTGRERQVGDTYRPTTVMGDVELTRRLESSLAATIANVPGISQQYNGPAASQPVIRGMRGDRVLVLEDGQRTGDLATTGADHAVTIDPVTAQRVEVVRGPAGLMYGSNALGGVINVVREEVPRTLPESVSGTLTAQAQSVNAALTGGGAVLVPLGDFAVRGEISARTAGDTETPLGELPSSGLGSVGGSLGASLVRPWGFIGAAVRELDFDYGVPGEFQGEVIPGAHPGGVDIETHRRTARVEGGHFEGFGPISSVTLDANVVQYQHREIEGRAGDQEIVGASFDNVSGGANILFRHEHDVHRFLIEGAFGAAATARELNVGGGFTGSRDASAASIAGYVYEELVLSPVRVQIGGRYDLSRVTPNDLSPIRTGEREIAVREREFGAASGSLAGLVEPRDGFVLGATLARAFRTPSVEELYSDGPHLADYSYDIGNPDLDPEFGLGLDLFFRIDHPRLQVEASAYRNALSNYIYHAPTAELDPRFNRFPVFEARGADALFEGVEAGVQWEVVRRLVLDGSASFVRATQRDTDDPLPAIPPASGSLEVRYETDAFFLSGAWESVAAQDRVPRPFVSPVDGTTMIQPEQPTAGHNLVDAGVGLRLLIGERLHLVTLQVDNLTDAVWRDHLSRLKEVAPQPGRNVQILYRVQF